MPLERATLHVISLDRTRKVLLFWLICYIFVFHITQLLLILEGNYEYAYCKCEQHVCDISLCVFFISVEESCPTLLCRIVITQSRWPAAKNRCLSESFRCYSGFSYPDFFLNFLQRNAGGFDTRFSLVLICSCVYLGHSIFCLC